MTLIYRVTDKKINHTYEFVGPAEVKFYLFRIGIMKVYSEAMKLSTEQAIAYLIKNNHTVVEGELEMESFVGSDKGDKDQKQEALKGAYKQRHDKPYESADVELSFFDLIDMSYDDLLDMYNDYSQMYEAFKDYTYKINAKMAMEALITKGAKDNKNKKEQEVNVS